MTSEEFVAELLKIEAGENGDVASDYNEHAWRAVYQGLTPQEIESIKDRLGFIYDDNSGDPIWEKIQDLLIKWEERYYGCPDVDEVAHDLRIILGARPSAKEVLVRALEAPAITGHTELIQHLIHSRVFWESSTLSFKEVMICAFRMCEDLAAKFGLTQQEIKERLS